MTNKYRFRRLLPLIILLLLAGVSIYLIIILIGEYPEPMYYVYPFLAIFLIGIYWLIQVELSKKAIDINIQTDRILVKTFAGFGKQSEYFWIDFDGYSIKQFDSEYQSFEFLTLYSAGKKIISISEFYHEDYALLKSTIKSILKSVRSY